MNEFDFLQRRFAPVSPFRRGRLWVRLPEYFQLGFGGARLLASRVFSEKFGAGGRSPYPIGFGQPALWESAEPSRRHPVAGTQRL
jgi:hypothetical protein